MAINRSKRVIAALMLLVPALFGIAPVFAEEQQMSDAEKLNHFKLHTNCTPIGLIVEDPGPFAAEIALTKKDIIAVAESRFRFARIYSAEVRNAFLYINVNVSKRAYSISVQFKKMVVEVFSGYNYFASTWDAGAVGLHGRNHAYILSNVIEHVDQFIIELLRANDKACEKR